MRFVFISAHKVFGIILKPTDPDVPLIQTEDGKLSVFITGSLDKHHEVLDRQTALAVMLLSGRVKQPLPDDFSDQLSNQIDAIRKQRSELADGTGIAVVQITGDIEAVIPEPRRNIADFILCFDAFDKKALASQLQLTVTSALAGLRVGARGDYEFEQISSSSYLVTDEGLIIHSFTAEFGSPRAYVSSPRNDEQIARIKKSIELLNRSGELARAARLYAQSINQGTDSFRAFVSAWAALEILIGKIFPIYQRQLASQLETVSVAPGLKTYLTRVADVMSDKHTLADKFAVIAMFLDEAQDPREIELFKKLKKDSRPSLARRRPTRWKPPNN